MIGRNGVRLKVDITEEWSRFLSNGVDSSVRW